MRNQRVCEPHYTRYAFYSEKDTASRAVWLFYGFSFFSFSYIFSFMVLYFSFSFTLTKAEY